MAGRFMDDLKVLKSARVLIVEDSPSDVRLIREALRSSELIVHLSVCKDGAEALEFLQQAKNTPHTLPDLILLDLNLPRKSGHEVLNEIKHDPRLKKIPVLIMSSSADERDLMAAYELNANCYIRKPSDLLEYERVVRAIEDFWLSTVTLPETYNVSPVALGRAAGDQVVR
jgi:chemotaxis family two-component system response regulator Rcp1